MAIFQKAIPHYRVPFFAAVESRAREAGLETTVFTSDAAAAGAEGRFRCLGFPVRALGGGGNGLTWMSGVAAALRETDVIVAPQEIGCLTVPYLWLRRRGLCRCWIWWGHGFHYRRGSRPEGFHRVTEGVRRFVSSRGDGLLAYTENGADYWRSRGMPEDRVIAYRNTIDVEGLRRAADRIGEDRPRELRRRMGLEGKKVLLFSGRLYPEKRVDLLLEAAAILQREKGDTGLLILGDGSLRGTLENHASRLHLRDVHFLGERTAPEESGIYFRMADLLVIPGLVGLAVVHGFAFGVPLVTTRHDGHSPEIEYLDDGCGRMTACDPASYAGGIRRLLDSPEDLAALKREASRRGDRLLLSESAERFVAGIKAFCGGNR